MAIVFLSHSSDDGTTAVRVKEALRNNGYDSVFLDIDDIRAGSRWRDKLARELRTADAVVFLGSAHSASSVWCTAELAIAKALEKLIYPIQIEPGATHELLSDDQWVMYRSTMDEALTRLISELMQSPDTAAHQRSWDGNRSPFPGLRPFTADDAGVFFGRDAEIDELVRITDPASLVDRGSIVVVEGPSGAGKSSLVRAGLIPRLSSGRRRPEATWVVVRPIVPSGATRPDLGRALAAAGVDPSIADAVATGAAGLSAAVDDLLRASARDVDRVLVVLDQADELCAQPDRVEFLTMLMAAAQSGSGCRVVLTVREGWFSRLFEGVDITGRLVTFNLAQLGRSALAAAIEGPARRADLTIEPGFVSHAVDDAHDGDALPLLALALERTYRSMVQDGSRQLTTDRYDAAGGVSRAVALQAADAVSRLGHKGEERVVGLLTRLVNVDEAGQWARRTRDVTTLTDDERTVLNALEAANLVVVERKDGSVSASVVHSRLFSAWSPVERELDKLGANLRFDRRVERDAADWHEQNRPLNLLPSGDRQRDIEREYGKLTQREPDGVTADYINAAHRQEVKRRWKWRAAWASAAALLLIAAVLGVGQLRASDRANEAARLAEARGLIGRAANEPRYDLALSMGLQAYEDDHSPETLSALVGILAREPRFRGYLGPAMAAPGRSLWWGESGALLVGDATGGVTQWDAAGEHRSLTSGGSLVRSVVEAPNGAWVAWADIDGRVFVRRSNTTVELQNDGRPAHVGVVADLAVVGDNLVASAADDGQAILWDVVEMRPVWSAAVGSRIRSLVGPTTRLGVVVGTETGEVVELGPVTGEPVATVQVGDEPVRSLALSERGVLVGDDVGRITLLDTSAAAGNLADDTEVVSLFEGPGVVRTLASAGPHGILSGWGDGSVRLLDARGQLRDELSAHVGSIRDIAYDWRTQWFAATADDGLISRWDLAGGSLLLDRLLNTNSDLVGDVDSRGRVYLGGTDRQVSILDPGETTPVPITADLGASVVDLDVADDDATVAVALQGGAVLVLGPGTGDTVAIFDVGGVSVDLTFSGHLLVAAGDDVRTYDLRSGDTHDIALPDGFDPGSVAVARDGDRIVVGGTAADDLGAGIVVWRSGQDPVSSSFGSPGLSISALDVNADGDSVVVGRTDGRLEIWDLEPLENTGIAFTRHNREIYDARFTRNGASVVSVDRLGVLWTWSAAFGTSAANPVSTGFDYARRLIPDADGTSITIIGRHGVALAKLDAERAKALACELARQGCR